MMIIWAMVSACKRRRSVGDVRKKDDDLGDGECMLEKTISW